VNLIKDSRRITFSDLLRKSGLAMPAFESEVLITGIVSDSRQTRPGDLFVALVGANSDGHRFIPDAIQRGAAAIVGTQPLSGVPVPYYQVAQGRWALALLSAAFYGFPARHLTVIGVTGTDGKTTTSNLIHNILRVGGLRAGMISTVNAIIGDEVYDTGFHVTTPEAPDVQRYLAQMVAAGLTHVVLEVTSHGLKQQRVEACEFDIAVVTNITHEHLDYHGTYEDYRASKAQLFTGLASSAAKVHSPRRAAVLNRDDSSYDYLAGITPVRQITYGLGEGAEIRASEIVHRSSGLRFRILSENYDVPILSALLGEYNVYNCLAAFAATVAGLELPPRAAQKGIADLKSIPGRMEVIQMGQEFLAIVDFAHTPNALRRALETARRLIDGRVIAVFGSAGLRDRAKRHMMAETSVDLADLTVLTAEDPRSEPLEDILAEMAEGAKGRGAVEGETFWRIPDRGEALHFALSLARPEDLVIACGKGHEQSMCFGEIEYAWDDRIAMRAALAEHLGVPGPGMPYLPTQDGIE
jgi:UDP-N-acetylmuramoyl-L-alanyl-D-glutamate--2,6-diaminopimelate ligase